MSLILRRHPMAVAVLLAPAVLASALFLFVPLVNGVRLSFTDASPLRPAEHYVGLENYIYLAGTPEFLTVVANSIGLVAAAIAISLVAGFSLALLLNQKLPGTGVFRAAVFQIWIVPWISVAILWGWIFNADYGIVNYILTSLGVIDQPLKWFSNEFTARLVIVLGFAWRMIPFMMVVSLAALQSIPAEILEAASIDGASVTARLRYVTLPILRPMLLSVAVLQAVKLFQEITLPWVLTQGGPVDATTTLSLYTYKLAFQQWDFGLASAVGTIWLVFLVLTAAVALKVSRRQHGT